MRKAISVAVIAVATILRGAGIAGATEPDHIVQAGDTLSELNPDGWIYVCIVNIGEGRLRSGDCDLIFPGERIRTQVNAAERASIDAWFAAFAGREAASAPTRAAVGTHRAASSPACAGLDGVDAELASRTCAAIGASGGACRVISGYRSYATQAELYRRYLAGTGNLAAPPGSSPHETGDAVDMSDGCAAELAAQDLVRTVPGEWWHWELP